MGPGSSCQEWIRRKCWAIFGAAHSRRRWRPLEFSGRSDDSPLFLAAMRTVMPKPVGAPVPRNALTAYALAGDRGPFHCRHERFRQQTGEPDALIVQSAKPQLRKLQADSIRRERGGLQAPQLAIERIAADAELTGGGGDISADRIEGRAGAACPPISQDCDFLRQSG